MICADDTDVERVHIAMIWINELDDTGIEPREIELKGLGFYDPKELLASGLNLEPWARIICQMLIAAEK